MSFKSKFFRLTLTMSLALSLSVAVFADTIRLKDGSIIKGKIVGFGGGRFTVVISDGTRQRQMNFTAAEVDSISFDAATGDAPNQTAETVENAVRPPVSIPQTAPTPAPVQTGASPINPAANSSADSSPVALKPITLNVSVLADNTSNGWTNSGFVVRKGQKIRIDGSGRISLGGGRFTTSEGISSLADANKLMPKEATGGLIAVIGDDNNDFIFIGSGREFTAPRDGALFLGVNEGNLDDNSGKYDVKVDIYPN
ncbi:MAG TPA: hypothetical protein VNI84_10205 [Pyrinomonadaceae bacterium]|nr:hypothetical protein [Pyrinomonadaceae bacterium]